MDFTESFQGSFSPTEVIKTTRSAWGYEERGENRFGAAATTSVDSDIILSHAANNPDAFALLSILKAQHGGLRDTFAVANSMAEALGWRLPRFKVAREYLVDAGLLQCLHRGGKGPRDPGIYSFG